MKKRKTELGTEYIQIIDSNNIKYSIVKGIKYNHSDKITVGANLTTDTIERVSSLLLSRKKALELSKILAYFGNTGELPRIYRGGISIIEPERDKFNPVKKENDIKPVKHKKSFVYCQTCSYCGKIKNMLHSFECEKCGKKILECRACHRVLPPAISNKKICKDCFNSTETNLTQEGILSNGKQ